MLVPYKDETTERFYWVDPATGDTTWEVRRHFAPDMVSFLIFLSLGADAWWLSAASERQQRMDRHLGRGAQVRPSLIFVYNTHATV